MPEPGDHHPGFIVEPMRCWAMACDGTMQADHLPGAAKRDGAGGGRSQGRRWWRVWSCPDHLDGLTGFGSLGYASSGDDLFGAAPGCPLLPPAFLNRTQGSTDRGVAYGGGGIDCIEARIYALEAQMARVVQMLDRGVTAGGLRLGIFVGATLAAATSGSVTWVTGTALALVIGVASATWIIGSGVSTMVEMRHPPRRQRPTFVTNNLWAVGRRGDPQPWRSFAGRRWN
jgi:hypothetical protein